MNVRFYVLYKPVSGKFLCYPLIQPPCKTYLQPYKMMHQQREGMSEVRISTHVTCILVDKRESFLPIRRTRTSLSSKCRRFSIFFLAENLATAFTSLCMYGNHIFTSIQLGADSSTKEAITVMIKWWRIDAAFLVNIYSASCTGPNLILYDPGQWARLILTTFIIVAGSPQLIIHFPDCVTVAATNNEFGGVLLTSFHETAFKKLS